MDYYIGIDGGGTKTKCILTDKNNHIVYECRGGPSNFLTIGTFPVAETISALIKECISFQKISSEDIRNIVLGTTGAGRELDASKMEFDFLDYCKSRKLKINSFKVVSDARIALEGAFSGGPGSILIAGTGSIMFGKDAAGNIIRVGGVGRLIGDEGSGFVLGKKGLNAFAKEYDGRGKKTIFSELLKEKFGITDQTTLINEVYKNNFNVADAAPLVISAAEKKDPVCLNILDSESDELLSHVKAMKQGLNQKVMRLSLIGSLLTTNNIYSGMFKEKIKKYYNDVIIQEPNYSPEMGAIILAKIL